MAEKLQEREVEAREEEQRAHQERLEFIAFLRERERRDFERQQRREMVEVSDDDGEDAPPPDQEGLRDWFQAKTIEELIRAKDLEKCGDCAHMSYVKGDALAAEKYQRRCQRPGC